MHISIDPERIFARHLAAIALMAGLYIIVEGLSIVTDHPSMLGLVQLVDLNGEFNLPSSFSTLAMLCSAVVLWLMGGLHKRAAMPYGVAWQLLACVMTFLAFDEMLKIHETLRDSIIRTGLPESVGWVGRSFSVWIVPYVMFAALLGLSFVNPLLALPRRIRVWIVGAGALYVFSAAGLEMIAALIDWDSDYSDLALHALIIIEECGEMTAIALLIRAALTYGGQIQSRLDYRD